MRLRAKVDKNQAILVKILRQLGFQVIHCHQMGKGFPDLILAKNNKMWMVEIKDGNKAKLTPDQEEFHQSWQGPPICILRNEDDAFKFPNYLGAEGVVPKPNTDNNPVTSKAQNDTGDGAI